MANALARFFHLLFFLSLCRTHYSNGYQIESITQDCNIVQAVLQATSPTTDKYGADIPTLQLLASYNGQNMVHVHITDQSQSRWEIPDSLIPRDSVDQKDCGCYSASSSLLDFSYTKDPFGFAISRSSTGETLFNTTPSANTQILNMTFKDQYLAISTSLPSSAALYGLGESTRSAGFKLASGSQYTLWAADIASMNTNINLYGSSPFYMDVRSDGNAHGVLFLNSNGMDVLYDPQSLTFKVIGGVFDFYFFAGPTPLSVMDQFTALVGRPAPMPYWSLGFHQCRYGYKNVRELETVVANYKSNNISLDVMWTDIDYMDAFKDFTVDPVNFPADLLSSFVNTLHANNQRYVIIIDPGIKYETNYSTYENGIEQNIFIKQADGSSYYLGQVWPGPVNFPDFFHTNIDSFWTTEISNFHHTIPFDGLWIDMNEVSNFCSGVSCTLPTDGECPVPGEQTTCCLVCSNANASQWDNPPYTINNSDDQRPIGNKTIAASAIHHGGILAYNAHNLYGFTEAIATNKALQQTRQERPFVLSRSTFIGSGAYAAHWTGDNAATWNDLAYSVVSVLNTGLFGIPMVGADICGFNGNTTEELCNRWIQLGAFYPFSRDHTSKDTISQELYLWETVASSARTALGLKYQMLPYLYTLVYEAHTTGAPIARPLFFHFTNDPATLSINSQFLLGESVLVSPVLTQGATTVSAYFPAASWYNLFNYSQVISLGVGAYQTLDAPLESINVHVKDGSILPLQGAALTTAEARNTSFTLLVVFASGANESEASGSLFVDSGVDLQMQVQKGTSSFITFKATAANGKCKMWSSVQEGDFAVNQQWVVEKITLLGGPFASSSSSDVLINGDAAPSSVAVKSHSPSFVDITGLNLLLGQTFRVEWPGCFTPVTSHSTTDFVTN